MRPEFLGDSYDIVKRFFCETLRSFGYTVYIDPVFTGDWSGQETTFYRFIGVEPLAGAMSPSAPTALFLDPDTGVNEKGSSSHVSYERLVAEAKNHSLVFVFDQAFSRAGETGPKLQAKLNRLADLGCAALYYASHAHFLFVSRERQRLQRLRDQLLALGLPASRVVEGAPNPTIAGDNPLLGTWRLKSFVREVAGTGERYNQLGEHPDGYLSYGADGRMLVLFVSDEQPRPRAEPTDDERIKLHKTMLAYGGTYTLSPGKVVHHIDIEWDGRRLGTDQVRFYTIDGDKLLLKTEPNKSPVDGREGVGILTFERVKPSLP